MKNEYENVHDIDVSPNKPSIRSSTECVVFLLTGIDANIYFNETWQWQYNLFSMFVDEHSTRRLAESAPEKVRIQVVHRSEFSSVKVFRSHLGGQWHSRAHSHSVILSRRELHNAGSHEAGEVGIPPGGGDFWWEKEKSPGGSGPRWDYIWKWI